MGVLGELLTLAAAVIAWLGGWEHLIALWLMSLVAVATFSRDAEPTDRAGILLFAPPLMMPAAAAIAWALGVLFPGLRG